MKVFAGPSLPPHSWLPPFAELRAPVRRGDLLGALGKSNALVLVLDGAFFHQPAVTHYELLRLLELGVSLWGAASMGALRAVELARHGMVGVGAVYRAYLQSIIQDDSEVATAMCPFTFQALTVPLVEVRHLLGMAADSGLPMAQIRRLFDIAEEIHFLQRTEKRLTNRWGESVTAGTVKELKNLWTLADWRLKTLDATEAIVRAAHSLDSAMPAASIRTARLYASGQVLTV